MIKIRNVGLIALLGATTISGCVSEKKYFEERPYEPTVKRRNEEWTKGINFISLQIVTEGPYKDMGYNFLDNREAKKLKTKEYIEIFEIINNRAERLLKIVYNEDGSIQNRTGNLFYIPEAVEQIRKTNQSHKTTKIIGIVN